MHCGRATHISIKRFILEMETIVDVHKVWLAGYIKCNDYCLCTSDATYGVSGTCVL